MPTPSASLRTKQDLERALAKPGFTPSFRDLPALLELADQEEIEDALEKALLSFGPTLGEKLPSELSAKAARLLCRVLGRLPTTRASFEFFTRRLEGTEADARRPAIVALGKVTKEFSEEAETALLAAFDQLTRDFEVRAAIEALGKVGGARARGLLEAHRSSTPDDARVLERARVMLARSIDREERHLDLDRALPELVVEYHCRRGLAPLLVSELAKFSPAAVDTTRVIVKRAARLGDLFEPRTALRFSFPIDLPAGASRRVGASDEPRGDGVTKDRVLAALASPIARALLEPPSGSSTVTRFRFRPLEGKQRALQWDLAKTISEKFSWLRNDPRDAEWELAETKRGFSLTPRPKIDPRFAYRLRDVPAASHPTIAAALARVAGTTPEDVVWDPFAGSALELIEHAKLGPAKRRVGSDIDRDALDAARANIACAAVDVEMLEHDVRKGAPFPKDAFRPTLIVTNPPFGHRVLTRDAVRDLLEETLVLARDLLAPGGRVVWLSPAPEATRAHARELGFRIGVGYPLDAGALEGEIQVLTRS